jgi:hypothetical protein
LGGAFNRKKLRAFYPQRHRRRYIGSQRYLVSRGEKILINKKIIIAVVVILIVVIVGTGAWICTNSSPLNPSPTPTPTPAVSTQEQARNAAITHIQTSHTETAPLMTSLTWTGGRATPEGLVGAETYVYTTTTGWNVTVQNPVIPNPIYTVTATYTSGTTAVNWQGTYENSTITETSYTYTP